MSATIINSPYSGRPVKVREQDLGRAVRDEEGRVFYVVKRADGQGYYSAMTRKGSEREEKAYDEMAAKMAAAKASGAEQSRAQVHDATGPGRSSVRGKLVIAVLALLVLALLALWYYSRGKWQAVPAELRDRPIPVDPMPATPPPPAPAPAPETPAAPGVQGSGIEAEPQALGGGVGEVVALLQEDAKRGPAEITTPSGLRVTIDRPGHADAAHAAPFNVVTIHYTAKLDTGSVWDATAADAPLTTRLSPDDLITGLVEGITGMAVGEKRTVIIPPQLGYGARGAGALVPPNATLTYEVELLAVKQ